METVNWQAATTAALPCLKTRTICYWAVSTGRRWNIFFPMAVHCCIVVMIWKMLYSVSLHFLPRLYLLYWIRIAVQCPHRWLHSIQCMDNTADPCYWSKICSKCKYESTVGLWSLHKVKVLSCYHMMCTCDTFYWYHCLRSNLHDKFYIRFLSHEGAMTLVLQMIPVHHCTLETASNPG